MPALKYDTRLNVSYCDIIATGFSAVRVVPLGGFMAGKTSKISKLEYEALADFRWALRQFLSFSEAAARAAGITPQQHQALLAIKGVKGRDSITVGELAGRLQILPHSAVGLADRLAARQFVKRIPDRRDRRNVLLTLTERGEAVLEGLSAAHREQLRRISPQFRRLFEKLRQRPGLRPS
jgi:DNA-binding MarR family transcriptional regulator